MSSPGSQPRMPKLFDLPIDLVLEVSGYLSPVNLSMLARTSHDAWEIFNPLLYSLHGSQVLDTTSWDGKPGWEQTLLHLLNHISQPVKENPVLGSKLLSCAAAAGCTEIVRRLLKDGIPPESRHDFSPPPPPPPPPSSSPLSRAARGGHAEIVEMLLAAGADVSRFDHEDVFWALGGIKPCNHHPTAQLLIRHGMDIHSLSRQGNTPLHLFAGGYPDVSVVSLLLDHGVDMTVHDEDGSTPLDRAVQNVSRDESRIYEVVELLLRRGAPVNLPGDQAQQPLHTAVRVASPRVVKLLLDFGADVHAYNRENMSPLHLAAGRGDDGGQVIRLLLDAGASPASTGASSRERERTPLHVALDSHGQLHLRQLFDAWLVRFPGLPSCPDLLLLAAAALGDTSTLKRLLDRGDVDINTQRDGSTALMQAARRANDAAVELLLSRGADVNVERFFRTALHYALASRVESTVRLLLPSASLDSGARDIPSLLHDVIVYQPSLFPLFVGKLAGQPIYGDRLLPVAARYGYLEIVQALLEVCRFDSDCGQALIQAVKNRHNGVLRFLLESEPMPFIRYHHEELFRETPLIHAVREGYADIVDTLLADNAEAVRGHMDGRDGRYGRDPMMWAAQEGWAGILDALLAHGGADVGALDGAGDRALSLAAYHGHATIVSKLVDAGAGIDEVNREGRTPFLMAAYGGQIRAAEELVKRGSNTRHRDHGGQSALSLAAQRGHFAMVQWLAEQGMALDDVDVGGRTALSWAVGANSSQTVRVLLCAGCDMSKLDLQGRTPLGFAESDSMIACLYSATHRSLLKKSRQTKHI